MEPRLTGRRLHNGDGGMMGGDEGIGMGDKGQGEGMRGGDVG